MAATLDKARCARKMLASSAALALIACLAPDGALGLDLSETTLTISNQDQTAPAAGTLTLLGLFDELPPGSVSVTGVPGPNEVYLIVRGTLTAGEVFSLGGKVTGIGSGEGGGEFFCCIVGSGYTPNSERIPNPDEFFPDQWDWFFDDIADPGLWVPGETIEFWVAFTEIEPGAEIEFYAVGPDLDPACHPFCSFGSVTVLGRPTLPALGVSARIGLVVALAGGAFLAQRRRGRLRVRASVQSDGLARGRCPRGS